MAMWPQSNWPKSYGDQFVLQPRTRFLHPDHEQYPQVLNIDMDDRVFSRWFTYKTPGDFLYIAAMLIPGWDFPQASSRIPHRLLPSHTCALAHTHTHTHTYIYIDTRITVIHDSSVLFVYKCFHLSSWFQMIITIFYDWHMHNTHTYIYIYMSYTYSYIYIHMYVCVLYI